MSFTEADAIALIEAEERRREARGESRPFRCKHCKAPMYEEAFPYPHLACCNPECYGEATKRERWDIGPIDGSDKCGGVR